jgi:hypothetical protein
MPVPELPPLSAGIHATFGAHPNPEVPMLALVAAVLFVVALIFELINFSAGSIYILLITAGLVCGALYMAGVGARTWRR